MRQIKYLGNWSANNGSTYQHNYTFTNLREAKQTMRAICDGNVYAGNTGNWAVTDVGGDVKARGTCYNC